MRSLVLAAALALSATTVLAQDIDAEPTYGAINLNAGFMPDPRQRDIQAGGSVNAANGSSGCPGFIASAPDMRLFWSGDGSLPLIISANSHADTTLVINGPRGEWYCDDDGGEGFNPSVRLPAQPGRYEIWIGTYSSGTLQPATLSISEVQSF